MTAQAEIEELLAVAEDADDALRGAVQRLAAEPEISWAGVAFAEDGELTLGPSAGVEDEQRRQRTPIVFQGTLVGELWTDGDADDTFLASVANLLAAHVLIGWDTGGES